MRSYWQIIVSCIFFIIAPFYAIAGPNNTPYGGNGVSDGKNLAGNLVGNENINEKILGIIEGVLQIMGTVAVAMIIIAGLYLVVAGGTEEGRDRARKILLYTVIGLIVILLANAYVRFIIHAV